MPTKGRPRRDIAAHSFETDGRPGCSMMLAPGEGLKGCAARTGKPASALDPLARTPAFG